MATSFCLVARAAQPCPTPWQPPVHLRIMSSGTLSSTALHYLPCLHRYYELLCQHADLLKSYLCTATWVGVICWTWKHDQ